MAINYRKGFRRVYVVVVACWLTLCIAIAISGASTPFAETKLPEVAKTPSFYRLPLGEQRQRLGQANADFAGLPLEEQDKVLVTLSKELEVYRRKRFARALELALIPPSIGYAFFFVIVPWIATGFRSTKEKRLNP